MNVPELCIRRPVMTILVMAAFIIFGSFAYRSLPVSELPNVDFPTISVFATLPGADPETMATSVAKPLENQFSSIAGVDSMTSMNTQGRTRITLQFNLNRDIDAAAQDVQSAIAATVRRLPSEMTDPPTYRKVNPSDFSIFLLALSSPTLPLSTVGEYAETLLAQRLSTVTGVAQVNVFGSTKFALRVQVNPDALATRGVGIDEVEKAVRSGNVNLPTGTLDGAHQTVTIRTRGQLTDAASYRTLIVTYRNGAPVRIQDIGQVVDGIENNKVASWFKGKRAVVLAIQRQPGSNTIEVVDAIKDVLPTFQVQLPAAMHMEVLYDRTQSIRASIEDVQFTLLLAASLVVLVIFLFLRNLSATIIPSLALPISVIGTFAGMHLFGFSIDNLSLMALTLSVGFVVDDAIVVLENIVRHMERGESPFQAAVKGSKEIAFTVLSMTVSLAAVFIPVLFMGGIVGRLLNEFAVTIVLAIFTSGIVSLTLTPMMASRFVRPPREVRHGGLYKASERVFDAVRAGYDRSLKWCLGHRRTVFGVFVLTMVGTGYAYVVTPKDFLPSADIGSIQVFTEGAEDSSFESMVRLQSRLADIVAGDPNVASYMSSVGAGGPRATGNAGTIFIRLKPRGERELSADQVIQELRPKLTSVPGINAFLQNPPSIRVGGYSSKGAYQYTLQDLDTDVLYATAARMLAAVRGIPGFVDVTSDMDLRSPTLIVHIDRNKAASLGVTAQQIENALASAFGAQQISTIYTSSTQYQVILEVEPRFQGDPATLSRLYVRSSLGQLVPLSAITTVSRGVGPLAVNHQGLLPAVTISFNLVRGMALGDAVDSIHRIERAAGLPATVRTSFQGTAQAFQASLKGLGLLLFLGILVVYMVLGILYESFIHPFTILSGLPAAGVGALLTLNVFHISLSLYAFVGIIMLVGIVKKNAIMMIDFALVRQRRDKLTAADAIYEAALIRFRPIMMTTMAALMGTFPIAVALGDGSEARQPLGLAVVGGLLVSQFLTLYVTPVIYVYLDKLAGVRLPTLVRRGATEDMATEPGRQG